MSRNRILKTALMVLSLSLFTVGMIYAASGKTTTYRGWVVDQLCATKGAGFDGTDLSTSPQNHTVGCALMPPCIESGYGIYIDKGDGSFEFYKLDKNGSSLALKILKSETKKDHVQLEVGGVLTGDTIQVKTLKEI
jgi:hypothetical protein